MTQPGIPERHRAGAEQALRELCASVLIVDDDEQTLEAMRALLEAEGHACTTALTGREALELCRQTRYDCLLIDHQLGGGVSGLAVAQRLGGVGSPMRPTYILLMTLPGSDGFESAMRDRVIDGHLFKPVTIELLRDHVGKSLRFGRV